MPDRAAAPGRLLHRMTMMSDAVIAIALTLLVLNVVVPALDADESLASALSDLASQAFAWVLSFVVIAVLWFSHHETVDELEGADWAVVTANFAFLGLISTLPFTSDLLGTHGGEALATVLYAANIALLILSLVVIEVVADVRGLRSDDAPRTGGVELYVPLAFFLVSIPIAFVDATLAKWTWALSVLAAPIERLVARTRGPTRARR